MKITSDEIDGAYDAFCSKPLGSSDEKLYAQVLGTRAFGYLVAHIFGANPFMAVPEFLREKMAVSLAHFMAAGIILGLELSAEKVSPERVDG